jgi:hypothetical protein
MSQAINEAKREQRAYSEIKGRSVRVGPFHLSQREYAEGDAQPV